MYTLSTLNRSVVDAPPLSNLHIAHEAHAEAAGLAVSYILITLRWPSIAQDLVLMPCGNSCIWKTQYYVTAQPFDMYPSVYSRVLNKSSQYEIKRLVPVYSHQASCRMLILS